MAVPVIMPRQGQSVESCIIAKWFKKKGDKVNAGEVLFSYETDKASFEEEARVSGTLLDVFFEEGDDVPCLVNVCVIGSEGESTSEYNPNSKTVQSPANYGSENQDAKQKLQTENIVSQAVPALSATDGEAKISPRAKNLAEKEGLDYRYANPTGPGGRIIERDIAALRESGAVFTAPALEQNMKNRMPDIVNGTGLGGRITTADINTGGSKVVPVSALPLEKAAEIQNEEVKLTNIRKTIAKAMFQSLSTSAQLTLNTTFDATDILEFRKKLKDGRERQFLENITLNDIIIYAVSRTLLYHKGLNAHFLEDRMLYFKNVNMGVAVDTERGLMVPVVMNANLKSLNDISREVKQLAKDCQSGSINPDLLKNGSFTISNLGALDIESFTPVGFA